MNREEFYESVKRDIKPYLNVNSEAEIIIDKFYKTNDLELTGMRARTEGVDISPNLYLDDYYDEYSKGQSYEETLLRIGDAYNGALVEAWKVKPNTLDLSFDKIQDLLDVQIVDATLNRNRLRELAHTNLGCGFVATYNIVYKETEDGRASMPVTRDTIPLIGVSLETIHETAFKNMEENRPATFVDMGAKMFSFGYSESDDKNYLSEDMEISDDVPMYVLSTTSLFNGATALWYKDSLKTIGKILGDDFFALPSSRHEFIIVPKHLAPSPNDLARTVVSVNSNELDPKDLLSNKVLAYRRNQEKLYIAADPDRAREEAR